MLADNFELRVVSPAPLRELDDVPPMLISPPILGLLARMELLIPRSAVIAADVLVSRLVLVDAVLPPTAVSDMIIVTISLT